MFLNWLKTEPVEMCTDIKLPQLIKNLITIIMKLRENIMTNMIIHKNANICIYIYK